MPFVVYSEDNITSANIGRALLAEGNFEEAGRISGYRHFSRGNVDAIALGKDILSSDFLDSILRTDLIIFVCSHSSSRGVASFTVHYEGNWSNEAKLGGRPKELSVAAPEFGLALMMNLKKNNNTGLPVIYEATHHGPLLSTPSLFVEVGGTREALESERYAQIVAKSVIGTVDEGAHWSGMKSCALGIGGLHYEDKFTRLAFGSGYAFSHMMARHHISEVGMLGQAVERSSIRPDKALIEWKSIRASDRVAVIAELNRLGIDYERV